MPIAKELKIYLNDFSDIPEEYQPEFKTAIAMVDWERLLEDLYDESSEELFPFIRKTLLAAVMLTNTFAETAAISANGVIETRFRKRIVCTSMYRDKKFFICGMANKNNYPQFYTQSRESWKKAGNQDKMCI